MDEVLDSNNDTATTDQGYSPTWVSTPATDHNPDHSEGLCHNPTQAANQNPHPRVSGREADTTLPVARSPGATDRLSQHLSLMCIDATLRDYTPNRGSAGRQSLHINLPQWQQHRLLLNTNNMKPGNRQLCRQGALQLPSPSYSGSDSHTPHNNTRPDPSMCELHGSRGPCGGQASCLARVWQRQLEQEHQPQQG